MKKINTLALLCISAFILAGCGAKDNTPIPKPLTPIKTSLQVTKLWSHSTHGGSDEQYLQLGPALNGQHIATVDYKGYVNLFSVEGQRLWSTELKAPLSASPCLAEAKVFVPAINGMLYALDENSGKVLWSVAAPSSILTPVAVGKGIVVAHPHNGDVIAFDATSGKELWHYIGTTPQLTLEGNSPPVIHDNAVIVGFDNGQVMAFNLSNGQTLWQQTVASPRGSSVVASMVDIVGTPALVGNTAYVVSYQGNVAAMNTGSGDEQWLQKMSSYAGLAVGANKVVVTDAMGKVWALDQTSGRKLWVQDALEARFVTAPAIVGDYVVVGDYQGYVHWLSLNDGHFVARQRVDSSGIGAAPVAEANRVYVNSNDGTLAAFAK